MKTIGRPEACKRGTSEAFLPVVKRVLSPSDSLGALLAFVELPGTAAKPCNEILVGSVEVRMRANCDPWT
jgi:hypothetical protein